MKKQFSSLRPKSQIQRLSLTPSPHLKIVYMNKSQAGTCRSENFATNHKVSRAI